MTACRCTISSRKYASPFLHTTLRQIWGEGVCSEILFVPCVHHFLCSSQSMLGVYNHNGSLDEHVLYRNSMALLCFFKINQSNVHHQGWQEPPQGMFPVWATKTLVVSSKHAVVHVFSVYVFLNINDTGLNWKLTKACPEDAHLHKNLELRRYEAVCSKGTYFCELTVYASQSPTVSSSWVIHSTCVYEAKYEPCH